MRTPRSRSANRTTSPASSPVEKRPARPALEFRAVTQDRWDDLVSLFGARGACGGCWCMAWHLTSRDYQSGKGARNRARLRRLVARGDAPGVLAYSGTKAVGWCAVAPRSAYSFLERSRVLKPIDDAPVWSVSCLFVAREWRRQGVAVALLESAVRFARERGAAIVEGYPVVPGAARIPDVFAWTGTVSAFLAAGFREPGRWSDARPIMRRDV